MLRRNHIFDTVRQVFEQYGYMPIETPAMELLTTLMGKYGEEGDKLLFKVLNSGNFLEGLDAESVRDAQPNALALKISEKGLRYDLTVPLARYVVQHYAEIVFPFKRYQVQPVWRADKPQKGRYREFYQCDVDVIGSPSLLNEVELVQVIFDVFQKLGIPVVTRLNNRKILAGIAAVSGAGDRFTDFTVALDKMDKLGRMKVFEELASKGVEPAVISRLEPFLELSGTYHAKIDQLEALLAGSVEGQTGLKEIAGIFHHLRNLGLDDRCDLDLSLARGLNYYTGTIIEVRALGVEMGSICGGGRYDDLTGIFGMPGLSGVGISFGADRIYDVMQSLELFPEKNGSLTDILFVNFGDEEAAFCMDLAREMRKAGYHAEVYPDAAKLKKQMKYADQSGIPVVVLAGGNEIAAGKVTVKSMKTGEQEDLAPGELVLALSRLTGKAPAGTHSPKRRS
jgi:histidyl-tRNA synthetase